MFLSHGPGQQGKIKVSVYKEFLESPSLKFHLEWLEEGMGLRRKEVLVLWLEWGIVWC